MGELGLSLIPEYAVLFDVFAAFPPPTTIWFLIYIG
jgi:hypothetical protein